MRGTRSGCWAAGEAFYGFLALQQLARQPRSRLSAGAVIALLVALWSASRGAGALMKALNEIYERLRSLSNLDRTYGSVAATVALLLYSWTPTSPRRGEQLY